MRQVDVRHLQLHLSGERRRPAGAVACKLPFFCVCNLASTCNKSSGPLYNAAYASARGIALSKRLSLRSPRRMRRVAVQRIANLAI